MSYSNLDHMRKLAAPVGYIGRCDGGMTGSTTAIVCRELAGFGEDHFNTDYVMVILLDDDGHGTAPEGEAKAISNYVTATGAFTTAAFSGNVEENDVIWVVRREQLVIDSLALKTTPATDSFAYKVAQFIAGSDGDFAGATTLGANKSLVDVLGSDGIVNLSHDYTDLSLLQFLHGFHNEVIILFVIPEALGSIGTDNTTLQTELGVHGEVVTITQADALAYPEFSSITICVLGTTTQGTAWTPANLADLALVPNLPLVCVDKVVAAYLELGTDGGDAAAKTAIIAIANIKGSILGAGLHDDVGLAVGANTVSSSATYHTLDMSDADITETWFASESQEDNTDVVIGLIERVQADGTIGIDETGTEVPATMAFYGCGYEFNKLNTLGKAAFRLLVERLIHGTTVGQAVTIAGDIGNIQNKLFGNMTSKHNVSTPLAAFISGNSGGVGTELPNSISIFDILSRTGDPAWPAAAAPGNDVSFAEVLRQLYDDLVVVAADVIETAAGKAQIFTTTIDLHQAAATYDVALATDQAVLIESLVFSPRDDISNDVGGITAVTFQTDTATEQEFINNTDGAIANLTTEAQIAWTGAVLLRATDKIQFTIEGGTADAEPSTCDVIIKFRANVDGGTLA